MDFLIMNEKLKLAKKGRKFYTEKYNFYDTTENRILDVELYVPYRKLKSEGLEFCNAKPNDKPKIYSVKLTEINQNILKTLEWRNNRDIFQNYYRDMNAILFYDAFNFKYYCFNAEFLGTFNNFLKNYKQNYIYEHWTTAFDRYFKDGIVLSPVIVHLIKITN